MESTSENNTNKPVSIWYQRFTVALLFLLMLGSVASFDDVPYSNFRGVDFHNLHIFHNCQYADRPYDASGEDCGDQMRRGINYPPLFYWSYSWSRGIAHELGYKNLIIATCFSMLLVFLLLLHFYLGSAQKKYSPQVVGKALIYWLLLLLGLPFVGSVEKGNTDPLVVLFWLIGMTCFVKKYYFHCGAIMALTVFYKIYPVIAFSIIGTSFFIAQYLDNASTTKKNLTNKYKPLVLLMGGFGLAAIAILLSMWQLHVDYFTKVIPEFSALRSSVSSFTHSIYVLDDILSGASIIARLLLIVSWIILSIKIINRDPVLVFAGALSISTFFTGISFDYNLVTTFPLLFTLFMRSNSVHELVIVLIGTLAFIGNREIWHAISFQQLRVLVEVLWLIVLPVWLLAKPHLFQLRNAA